MHNELQRHLDNIDAIKSVLMKHDIEIEGLKHLAIVLAIAHQTLGVASLGSGQQRYGELLIVRDAQVVAQALPHALTLCTAQ